MSSWIPSYEATVNLLRKSMADVGEGDVGESDAQQACAGVEMPGAKRPTRDDVLAALHAVTDNPPLSHQRIGVAIKCMSDHLSFDRLSRVDTALVDVLVATGRFDVVLVNFNIEACYSTNVLRALFHPACAVPPIVTSRFPHETSALYTFVDENTPLSCEIVFWPKPFRASFLALDAVLSLTHAAVCHGDGDTLGLSLHGLCFGAIGAFVEQGSARNMVGIQDIVVQSHDVSLAELFLREAMPVWRDFDSGVLATCTAACLVAYGIAALLPSTQIHFTLWLRARGPSDLCRLLTSLAGLTTGDDVLCPRLRSRFLWELVKMGWDVLRTHSPYSQHIDLTMQH
ncbi:hypothetical protein SDRG_15279 [Saprolegnia diclina VS20]|uniref:Uncharacterized protein n=1 Tax=Saprolegnia diclina (strain VS20) TaxID=1156394 RepID=T0R4H4_SAPDV|nr:hypothetical protein SDRG_15279 [Saprolegnia diclina VS20]EQC26948.1 hypothetical protein SDRG_15279 [Saprolegnia diclina VS20]|eukprot:XP_008619669.1 hypothetical protein SDRG_15279 [Saprolegnia diclina VS20]